MDQGNESEPPNEHIEDSLSDEDADETSDEESEEEEEDEQEEEVQDEEEEDTVQNQHSAPQDESFTQWSQNNDLGDILSPITRIRRRGSTPQVVPAQRRRAIPTPPNWANATGFIPLTQDFVPPRTPFHFEFNLANDASPFEIMQYFWGTDIIQNICNETNKYAEIIKANNPRSLMKWTPLAPEEFWKFMALSTLMGIVKKSAIKDYWSTDEMICTPMFPKVMTRDRYVDILRSLHFVDNSTVPRNNKDRFVKFGGVMNHIFEKFRHFVNAQEYVCIDESLMPYKGRLSFKQYVPTKRARFGVKFFVLVDCATKAVLKMIPYQGKGTGLNPQFARFGVGGSVVVSLLEQDYLNKWHRVVADNWFSTPGLVKYLQENETYYLGTMQKRRSGDLKPQLGRKLKKGDVECFVKDGIVVERWMDRREVCMINSFLKHDMIDSLSTNPNNSRKKPLSVLTYNSKMGGVDDVDKVMKPHQSIRKSTKWYKKAFFHLWDYTVYNSYIAYKLHNPNSKRRIKTFIESFVKEVFQEFPTPVVKKGRPATSLVLDRRLVGSHFPEQITNGNGDNQKNRCSYCSATGIRSSTAYRCDQCHTWLCVKGNVSCFKKYHTEKKLPVAIRS